MNFVNDSSIRVTRVFEDKDGGVVLEIEDDDSTDTVAFLPSEGREYREIPVEELMNEDES